MTDEQIREWAVNLAHAIFQPNFGDVAAGIETAARELLAMRDLPSTQAMLEKGEREVENMVQARLQWVRDCGRAGLPMPSDHALEAFAQGWDEGIASATAPSNHRDAEDAEKYRKLGPPIPAGKALEKFVTLVDRAYKMMEMAGYQIAEHDPKHNNPIIAWMADAREALHIDSLKAKTMSDPAFKKEDVWTVARAIGNGVYVEETNSMNSYRRCSYCDAREYHDWQEPEGWQDTFQHDKGCVTLVARDLLVGCECPSEEGSWLRLMSIF